MRLPWNADAIAVIGESTIQHCILERRKAIREHRDQRGDNRCWLDDYLIWVFLMDTPLEPQFLWPLEAMMTVCREFHRYRNATEPDPVPEGAIMDPEAWDRDLLRMDSRERINELVRIQLAIRCHRDLPFKRPRTLDDDRALYAVLPELVPADFRLPSAEDFLGEDRAPKAGCPAFWRSHRKCHVPCHNLHAWGPCV